MKQLDLERRKGVPGGQIRLPASKSISNRLLILARLSGGRIELEGLSTSNDTKVLSKAIQGLDEGKELIDLGEAGTAYRFLTALATLESGQHTLTGAPRMKERPIGPLVQALESLGGRIEYLEKNEYPPLRIEGGTLKGGSVEMRSEISSQYLSALALVAPATERGVKVRIEGEPVSAPYFRMTLSLLQEFGVPVEEFEDGLKVSPHPLPARKMSVEGDHSSAAFWYELLALTGKGAIFLEGLREDSPQGDRDLPLFFRELGVRERWERGGCWIEAVPGECASSYYEADMRGHPDLVPPLVVSLAVQGKKALLRGVGHLRHKESDRLEALRQELGKLGVDLFLEKDRVGIEPGRIDLSSTPTFEVHNDHRIAMALAPLASILPCFAIKDPEVVDKSYPGFWEAFDEVLPG